MKMKIKLFIMFLKKYSSLFVKFLSILIFLFFPLYLSPLILLYATFFFSSMICKKYNNNSESAL